MSTSTSAARWSAGQGAQRVEHHPAPLLGDRAVGGILGLGGGGGQRAAADVLVEVVGQRVGAAYLRGPDPVQAGVDDDPVQPGRDRRLAAERARAPVRRDQAVLEPVGGVLAGCPWCAARPPTAGRGAGRRGHRRRRRHRATWAESSSASERSSAAAIDAAVSHGPRPRRPRPRNPPSTGGIEVSQTTRNRPVAGLVQGDPGRAASSSAAVGDRLQARTPVGALVGDVDARPRSGRRPGEVDRADLRAALPRSRASPAPVLRPPGPKFCW